jgi:hypothetical protein
MSGFVQMGATTVPIKLACPNMDETEFPGLWAFAYSYYTRANICNYVAVVVDVSRVGSDQNGTSKTQP